MSPLCSCEPEKKKCNFDTNLFRRKTPRSHIHNKTQKNNDRRPLHKKTPSYKLTWIQRPLICKIHTVCAVWQELSAKNNSRSLNKVTLFFIFLVSYAKWHLCTCVFFFTIKSLINALERCSTSKIVSILLSRWFQ